MAARDRISSKAFRDIPGNLDLSPNYPVRNGDLSEKTGKLSTTQKHFANVFKTISLFKEVRYTNEKLRQKVFDIT